QAAHRPGGARPQRGAVGAQPAGGHHDAGAGFERVPGAGPPQAGHDEGRRGQARGGVGLMDPRDVLKRPIITEEATMLMEQGKYEVEVDRNANKTQIKQAVEQVFNVKVTKVNTMRQAGKLRRQGRTQGRTREIKKAIVTLAEGQSIPIFEGL